jgi:hypothetical protein
MEQTSLIKGFGEGYVRCEVASIAALSMRETQPRPRPEGNLQLSTPAYTH